MIRFLREIDGPMWVLVGLASFLVALIVIAVQVNAEESASWDQFKVENSCRVVEKRKGYSSTGTVIGTNGKVGIGTVYTPSQTAWKCADGVIYWK